jgi:hypothetical protein
MKNQNDSSLDHERYLQIGNHAIQHLTSGEKRYCIIWVNAKKTRAIVDEFVESGAGTRASISRRRDGKWYAVYTHSQHFTFEPPPHVEEKEERVLRFLSDCTNEEIDEIIERALSEECKFQPLHTWNAQRKFFRGDVIPGLSFADCIGWDRCPTQYEKHNPKIYQILCNLCKHIQESWGGP